MWKFFLALFLAVGLAGCGNEGAYQQKAMEAIRGKLKDPASATFSDFIGPKTVPEILTKDSIIRVQVNAKNSFGGYTGAKEWVVLFDSSGKITTVGSQKELHGLLVAEVEKNMTPDKVIFAVFAAEKLALMGYPDYFVKANELLLKTK